MTKTVLIADDDVSARGMMGRLMRALDWRIIEATDGYTALEKLGSHHIDLLILDQLMPQLTGTEVLSVIRESATHSDLPVMVVTGAADEKTSETMLALGVTDYIVKPLRPEFVRDRLTKLDRTIRALPPPQRRVLADGRPKDGSVLAIVDGDVEHRRFVNRVLSQRFAVLQVPSAVAALRAALVERPAVFVIGANVGLMGPEFLARKLRERPELASARIVHVTRNPPEVKPAAFDGVIIRTLDEEEFLRQFDLIFDSVSDEPNTAPDA